MFAYQLNRLCLLVLGGICQRLFNFTMWLWSVHGKLDKKVESYKTYKLAVRLEQLMHKKRGQNKSS